MSASPKSDEITVVLLGNPNTGKSTVFNALAGVRQRVGNYPGVTVEKKTGRFEIGRKRFTLVDLPGTYSLAPRSPDEMVTVDVLLGRQRDLSAVGVVLCVLDASNLERNLYLVSQVLELGLPTVVVLNMMDVASEAGVKIDAPRLARQLGAGVVPMQANRGVGLAELKSALSVAAAGAKPPEPRSPFPETFQQEVSSLDAAIRADGDVTLPRYLVERLLLDTGGYLEKALLRGKSGSVLDLVRAAQDRLARAGLQVPGVETASRYRWASDVLTGVISQPAKRKVTLSDKIDGVLTHRLYGTMIFVVVMMFVFQSIFTWTGPAMEGIGWVMNGLGGLVEDAMSEGPLRSLIVDGAIAGVGGVLTFLPQILVLFMFIAILEDCGYMSRAAYLMDRLMSRVGLSGKSFIPLFCSFACAIPGIMATRVIENRRDRLVTILVAPLMSCGARLPIYMLFVKAFIPERTLLGGVIGLQGITMLAVYMLGIVTAVVAMLVLKKTILRGETPPFMMELPSYKMPSPGTVLLRMFERGWAFVRQAGTVIFAATVLVWALAYYPHDADTVERPFRPELLEVEEEIAFIQSQGGADGSSELDQPQRRRLEELELAKKDVKNLIAGAYMQQSYLGQSGHLIEPAVRPLGWDWRIGCAVISSFPAREVVIGTLGVICNLGEGHDEASRLLPAKLKSLTHEGSGLPVFNVPVALSVIVFFALCAQCVATLAVMRRETNGWRWPVFAFVYMTVLAYVGAFVTYRIGMLFVS